MNYYFQYSSNPSIIDGLVSIVGNCRLKKRVDQLPIKFSSVTGDFIISDNSLTSLEGSPTYVGGDFDCSDNKLTSLKGSPSIVDGMYNCDGTELVSLRGAPSKTGNFSCFKNKLKTLDGAPSTINGWMDCGRNDLISLSGIPKSINGAFYITLYPKTPLLKILNIKGVDGFIIYYNDDSNTVNFELSGLFEKNYRTKNAIMKVGLEMIQLGYGSNARL